MSQQNFKSLHHTFDVDLACVYGLEKAAIINNLHLAKAVKLKKEELHFIFPYIPKGIFYNLLEDLIKKGLVKLEAENEV